MLDGYTYLYTLPTGARTKRKKGKGEILWRLDEHRGRNIYQKYIIIDGLEVALIFWLLFFPFVQYSSWSTMGDFIFCVGWVHICIGGADKKEEKEGRNLLETGRTSRTKYYLSKYIIIDGLEVALIFWLLFFPFVQYSSWSTMGDFIFCVGWVHICIHFQRGTERPRC